MEVRWKDREVGTLWIFLLSISRSVKEKNPLRQIMPLLSKLGTVLGGRGADSFLSQVIGEVMAGN